MKEKVNQIKGQYTEAAMAGGVSQSLGSQTVSYTHLTLPTN